MLLKAPITQFYVHSCGRSKIYILWLVNSKGKCGWSERISDIPGVELKLNIKNYGSANKWNLSISREDGKSIIWDTRQQNNV